jgi:hypothetical protein
MTSQKTILNINGDEMVLVTGIIKEVTKCFKEYMITVEHEKTERYRIRANLEAKIRQIDASKELLLSFLNTQYLERIRLYNIAEKVINIAIANNDNEMVKTSMIFIQNIYESGDKNKLMGNASQLLLTCGDK